MTNQEFDNCKLTTKLNFKESESARLILVHGFYLQVATDYYGIKIVILKEIIVMFNDPIKRTHRTK